MHIDCSCFQYIRINDYISHIKKDIHKNNSKKYFIIL